MDLFFVFFVMVACSYVVIRSTNDVQKISSMSEDLINNLSTKVFYLERKVFILEVVNLSLVVLVICLLYFYWVLLYYVRRKEDYVQMNIERFFLLLRIQVFFKSFVDSLMSFLDRLVLLFHSYFDNPIRRFELFLISNERLTLFFLFFYCILPHIIFFWFL